MDYLLEINDNFLKEKSNMRISALKVLADLTGSEPGCLLLARSPVLPTCLEILQQNDSEANGAILPALVNISAIEEGRNCILDTEPKGRVFKTIITLITVQNETTSSNVDLAEMLLGNLTHSGSIDMVISQLEPLSDFIKDLVRIFNSLPSQTNGANHNHIANILCNLSRHPQVRKILMDGDDPRESDLGKLLPFVSYKESVERRRGVVGVIKNCSFETTEHKWMLNDLDILPCLLLPLAGGELFSDDEMDALPIDLQYLPDTKRREPDSVVRKQLLETLNQLCTTKLGREFLREKNAYLILRELHKWESDRECLLACENVVDILIRTEDEIGRNNLVDGVDIPHDVVDKFIKTDNEYLQSSS